ncbi:GMC oxidoreductase [Phlyctema vagabunda]|uniref:GMC oxidoreductase n=1 Tax=Phlyctema vagabunda TaxID=108571 RepID=A0ABR4PHM2_9HELO
MCMLSAPVYRATTVERIGPENESDEAIWSHICQNTFSSWHMSCTARMGIDDKSACVDSSFRVFGVDRLRIVDMSVCPFVPNNHTQSTAYVVGELAAEKLIAEHDLDSRGTGVAFRL